MRYLLLATTLAIGCGQHSSTSERSSQATQLATVTLSVEGMTCGSCEVTIRVAATRLDGVESVDVSYDEGSATVHYDPAKIEPASVAEAITNLGYPSSVDEG
jgi:mercuric ion binding protein